eukprot:3990038-Prymnesium_polylepis.1
MTNGEPLSLTRIRISSITKPPRNCSRIAPFTSDTFSSLNAAPPPPPPPPPIERIEKNRFSASELSSEISAFGWSPNSRGDSGGDASSMYSRYCWYCPSSNGRKPGAS